MTRPASPAVTYQQDLDRTVYLAHAVAVVHSHGYVPASATDAEPTWREALVRLQDRAALSPADMRRAHQIVGWAASLKPRDPGGYRARLSACLAAERLPIQNLPLAASAVRAFNLHLYYEIRGRKSRAAHAASAAA